MMKHFYEWIVRHRKLVLAVFAVLTLVCAFCKQLISVNYDMNDYLPENSASTVALNVMDEEFGTAIPNARVMIKNVSVAEALEYKEKLKAIDGVSNVTWLDDAVSVEAPLETADADTVGDYYRDGNALFSVTVEEDKRIPAVNSIRALIGEDNAMSGSAVSTVTATQSTVSEIARIAVIAVIFVFFVLLLTNQTWLDPVIVLVGLGVAILINAGSNLIFGEISFVTNAAGNILQLAVSLDYSVFLLHRFRECREQTPDPEKAMVEALCMSTSSIMSSGLTTVIGFLALCLMQFQIGPDLGRALAKGIAISLVTVFVFMPALILCTYKWIDRTKHRPWLPSFDRFGHFVSKIMRPLVVVFMLLIVPCYLASNANGFYYGSSHIFGAATKLGQDTADIEDIFGKSDTYVLMVPKDDKGTQQQLSDALHEVPQISSILSYVDTVGAEIPETYLDQDIYDKLCSAHYTRFILSMDADYEGDETFALVKQIRGIAETYYPGQWYLAGEGVSTCDLRDTVTADMAKVNLVAIGAVFVVLLFALRSLLLPVILVLSIETAIWINLAIPYFTGSSLFYIAYLIISSVQLGATVDYAILLTERYKECQQTCSRKAAVPEVISAVTVSILTSGITLTVVGFLLGKGSTHGLLSQLGFLLGRGTLCSLAIVLFVLPGLLYLTDRFIVRRKKS